MQYSVKGSYEFRDRDNPYSGEFTIQDGKITGFIRDALGVSTVPQHDVSGAIKTEDGKVKLHFVKKPPKTSLFENIFYAFGKDGTEIQGDYTGRGVIADALDISLIVRDEDMPVYSDSSVEGHDAVLTLGAID